MNICTKVRESTHLNTITMISRVSSHNLFPTMQLIWNYSNCIWMCICICIYICICICNCIYICIWTFVLDFVCACICILHILEWSGGRGAPIIPIDVLHKLQKRFTVSFPPAFSISPNTPVSQPRKTNNFKKKKIMIQVQVLYKYIYKYYINTSTKT